MFVVKVIGGFDKLIDFLMRMFVIEVNIADKISSVNRHDVKSKH